MDSFSIFFSDGGDTSVGISPIDFEVKCDKWFIENLKEVGQYREFRKILEGVFSQFGQEIGFNSMDEDEIRKECENE